MAYTNAWDETQPLGTAAANTLDDIIRQLKLDVRQRMESIVENWSADPVKLKGTTGKVLILAHEALMANGNYHSMQIFADYVTLNDTGHIPIPVRVGWRIKKVEVICNRGAAASLDCSMVVHVFNVSPTGGGTFGPVNNSLNGNQLVVVYNDAAGFYVDSQSAVTVKIAPPSAASWNFVGIRVTYDETL